MIFKKMPFALVAMLSISVGFANSVSTLPSIDDPVEEAETPSVVSGEEPLEAAPENPSELPVDSLSASA